MYRITAVGLPCHACVRCFSNGGESKSNAVLNWYRGEISKGALNHDDKQMVLINRLDSLGHSINQYHEDRPSSGGSFFGNLFSKSKPAASTAPLGLYVHGGVGCGKTMLMDKFFETLDIPKQRIHFHEFMLDVHEQIHKYKLTLPPSHIKEKRSYDPIPVVAKHIASETSLLCFDEFQVTDVADAMILKRLFQTLFSENIIMVATGNRAPEDLYKNGLQRSNFLPFIPLLRAHCNVLDMDSNVDYRFLDLKPLEALPGGQAYIVNDPGRLDVVFEHLSHGKKIEKRTLNFLGRDLSIGLSAEKILITDFKELCEGPLSSADFRALAKAYTHVLVRDFPQLSMSRKTPLRRFIIMMDTFYDKQVKLVISSDVPMNELFNLSNHEDKSSADDLRLLMDDLGLTKDQAKEMNLFTGEDEIFSHKRALSRLTEMQCGDYWAE